MTKRIDPAKAEAMAEFDAAAAQVVPLLNPKKDERDYLAFIAIMGGGSWYRSPDKDKAVKGAVRQCFQDWSHLFKLNGTDAVVNVFDVTGHEHVEFGDGLGCRDLDTKEQIPRLEVVTAPFPKRKRR